MPDEQDEGRVKQSEGVETATMKLFTRLLPTLGFRGEVIPSSSIRSAAMIKCPENKTKHNVKEGFILSSQSTVKGSHGSRNRTPTTMKQGEMNGCCLAHFLFHLGPSPRNIASYNFGRSSYFN